MESFVVLCQCCIIIRCAETIQDVAKDISFAITANLFCHTAGWNQHLIKHMKITIQAYNVLLHHTITKDISTSRITFIPAILISNNKGHIATSNALLLHIVFNEVCHHRLRVICRHKDTLTLITLEAVPIVFFAFHLTIISRKLFWTPQTHTIHNSSCRVLAQSEVFIAIVCITHHLDHIGIIELCTIEENTLLGIRETFIGAHAPLIVLEEFLISRIWSDKQRFTTRLRHHLLITEVFD